MRQNEPKGLEFAESGKAKRPHKTTNLDVTQKSTLNRKDLELNIIKNFHKRAKLMCKQRTKASNDSEWETQKGSKNEKNTKHTTHAKTTRRQNQEQQYLHD